ncbi:MAG: helix-turn-helix transcriptional regulator [Patescibacteria group bacterium]
MKTKYLNFNQYKKELLKDPAVKQEYDRLQPEFALIRAVISARKERKLTQAELAKRIGTKQSVISRLEIGQANPSVAVLKRIAVALKSKLEIRFSPL